MTRLNARRLPADMRHGVDDVPPHATTAVQALQHVGLVAINFIFVLLVVDHAGASPAVRAGALSMAMLMCALGTVLHACRLGPLGSGYLLPAVASSIYLGPALMAVEQGGLPLLAGMLVFAGFTEVLLARLLPRMRPYFPPEIAGLVIFLVGVTLAVIGLRNLLGLRAAVPLGMAEAGVGGFTLALMVALQVWGRGVLGLGAALIGMLAGCAMAAAAGLFPPQAVGAGSAWGGLSWPRWGAEGLDFDLTLAPPFALTALASALKAMGSVVLAQRLNDAAWVRPDMDNVSRSLASDGITTVIGGLMGSPIGANPGSSNVGLMVATGVASRRVAWVTAALLAVLAFVPAATALFLRMPSVVAGAVLLFTACFILTNGMEMIVSRLMDARRTLVVGLTVAAGVGVEVFPEVARQAPHFLAPLLSSSLVCGTVLALLLNGLFRLGVGRTASLQIDPNLFKPEQLRTFVEHQGALWGARRDVMARAAQALDQLLDAVLTYCEPQGPLQLTLSFDEFNLRAELDHQGAAMVFSQVRPTLDDIVDSNDGVRRLAGYLLRLSADSVAAQPNGLRQVTRLHFEH
jgi:NCS2 family nucleobase:cation symporter-2